MGIYDESGESLERFVVVSCNFNVLMIHPRVLHGGRHLWLSSSDLPFTTESKQISGLYRFLLLVQL